MWTLEKEVEFDAAHRLRDYDGACARLHGHRWRVVVRIETEELQDGMVCDFTDIKRAVMKYDHKNLNDFSEFEDRPTAERIAQEIAWSVSSLAPEAERIVVSVWETPSSKVTYVLGD